MLFSDLKKFVTGTTGTDKEEPKAPDKKKAPRKLATIVDIEEPAALFPDETEEDRLI